MREGSLPAHTASGQLLIRPSI